MFEELDRINTRPEPWAFYTTRELWTDEHMSKQMLAYHLNDEVDLASRNAAFIDRSVAWIASRFDVRPGMKIADFGCGPGQYSTRLARRRADLTGIDFSQRSIEYAQNIAKQEELPITYVHHDYLNFRSEASFDLIIMIMCDYCALDPYRRKKILGIFRESLAPSGSILLDVHSLVFFTQKKESAIYEENLLNGFFSSNKYYGFLNTFKYEKEKATLDKYTIIESDYRREIYNWLQCFSEEDLKEEFSECGLTIESLYSDVAGTPFNPDAPEFAIVAKRS